MADERSLTETASGWPTTLPDYIAILRSRLWIILMLPVHWIMAWLPTTRKRMFAGALLGLVAALLIVTQAFPQILASPPVHIPYTVDSEFVRYADDQSSSIEMYSTSYTLDGNEILLSRSLAGNPLGTAIGRTLDSILPVWSRLMLRFTVPAEQLERLKQRKPGTGAITGCADQTCLVLAHWFFSKPAAGVSTGLASERVHWMPSALVAIPTAIFAGVMCAPR